MRTLDFLPGPLELPFEKGIINDVVVDDGEDEAKVMVVMLFRSQGELRQLERMMKMMVARQLLERMMKMKMKAVRLTLRKSKG